MDYTPEEDRATLVDRLNGIYRIPIRDGLGHVATSEEVSDTHFVRSFQTPPIQRKAAVEIILLRNVIQDLVSALDGRVHSRHALAALQTARAILAKANGQ